MVSDPRLGQFTPGNKNLCSLYAAPSNRIRVGASSLQAVFRASGAAVDVLSGCVLMQVIKAPDMIR